ncbi:MAG: hypothetical protein H7138_27820, partial [Myxococcales bacterium]|nr:hypothetical protein [Myxococcales bacterium]
SSAIGVAPRATAAAEGVFGEMTVPVASLVEGKWLSAQLNNKPTDPKNNVREMIAIKSGKLTREEEHEIYEF